MKWLSHDRQSEVAEHGSDSADFLSTAQERGLKTYLNWPVIGALGIALIVLILLFIR